MKFLIKSLENILVIITAENLEKKSKLRSFLKKKKFSMYSFLSGYRKNTFKISYSFFKNEKIPISQINLNQILNKNLGDRKIF